MSFNDPLRGWGLSLKDSYYIREVIQGCPKLRLHFRETVSELALHPKRPVWIQVMEQLL